MVGGRDGSVTRIDPNANEVVDTLRIGHPVGGVVAGAGAVWVSVR